MKMNNVLYIVACVLMINSFVFATVEKYKTPENVALVNGLISKTNDDLVALDEECKNSPDSQNCTELNKLARKLSIVKMQEQDLKDNKEKARNFKESNPTVFYQAKSIRALFRKQYKHYKKTNQLLPIAVSNQYVS